jgi:hypothetical protein
MGTDSSWNTYSSWVTDDTTTSSRAGLTWDYYGRAVRQRDTKSLSTEVILRQQEEERTFV